MLITVYQMLNPGFLGDNQQVVAVGEQILKKFNSHTVNVLSVEHDNVESLLKLKDSFLKAGKVVFILCGSHGDALLKTQEFQALLREKIFSEKPMVVWVGHQDPGLIASKDLLDIVAIPTYMVEGNKDLKVAFKDRLVAMQSVPNTLKQSELNVELEKWNKTYSNESIPTFKEGYIGVFLGGDAENTDKTYTYWSIRNAYEQGLAFGKLALNEKKFLLVTNGPRTGKFYPESKDHKSPTLRQFQKTGWIPHSELTTEQIAKPKKEETAHTAAAPVDPVSLAFIEGVMASRLETKMFLFLDFKFGKSAYKAVVGALYATQDNSIACYSGESISYSEIAYFIPYTYAFTVDSMNAGHRLALEHFTQRHMLAPFDFARTIKEQLLDRTRKDKVVLEGNSRDAEQIADLLSQRVTTDKKLEADKVASPVLVVHPHTEVDPDSDPQKLRSSARRGK